VRSKGIEREEHVALSQRLMIAQLREDGYIHARAYTYSNNTYSFLIGVFNVSRKAVNGEKNTIADLSRNKII